MNVTILKGNLARDPELRSTQSGTSVCNCAIAVNRRVKRGDNWVEEATFIDITIWGSRGEAFSKHFTKGSPVLVKGEIRMDQWTDKESGENRTKMKVHVDDWEFAGSAKGGGEGRTASFSDTSTPF